MAKERRVKSLRMRRLKEERRNRSHLRAKIFVESRRINNSWTRHFHGAKTHLSLVRAQPPGPSILLSSCVKSAGGDFPLPLGQPPLSPIDLHLQLFLWESAYLSHSLSSFSPPPSYPVFPRRCATPRVVPSDFQFYFLFRKPQRYPHPHFHGRPSRIPRIQSPRCILLSR